jgi:hypothetical protein
MKTNLLRMTIAAGVLGLSGAAYADIVTVTYTGPVTLVSNANGGVAPASDGDTLVATYVFITASLTVNGVAGVLPAFTTGDIQANTQVSQIGTVLFSEVTDNAGNRLESDVAGGNFSWSLAPPLTGVSYNPSGGDEAVIELQTASGDILGADVSNVTVTVTASTPVPEPSTWAMMLIGLAGIGVFSYRRSRVGPSHTV